MAKRIVNTDFWTDGKVVDMFSPEDKYFMLYLLTNPHTTQLGIYKLNPKIAAFETGYSQEAILVLIDRFEKKYDLIKYSKDTQEIALKNYLKHSIVKGGKPVFDLLDKELKQVKNFALIDFVFGELRKEANLNVTVIQLINSYSDIKKENDNDNDNDNEESWYESSNESSTSKTSIKPKPIRHKHGQYLNVLLSDEEMEKLMNEFPWDWQERIERLSEYIAYKGVKYKNHLATIRAWARKDKERNSNKDKQSLNEIVQELNDFWEGGS